MNVTKPHNVDQYKHSPWLEKYFKINSDKGAKAKNVISKIVLTN